MRIGEEYLLLGRAHGEAQRKALVLEAGLVRCKIGSDLRTRSSSNIGSSTIFRGNIFSARPGTNTASKVRPLAASIGPTNTFPYRWTGGGTDVSRSRGRQDAEDLIQSDRTDRSHGRQLR